MKDAIGREFVLEGHLIRRNDGLLSDDPILGVKAQPYLWPVVLGNNHMVKPKLRIRNFSPHELKVLGRAINSAWSAIADDICIAIGGKNCDHVSPATQIECTLDCERVRYYGFASIYGVDTDEREYNRKQAQALYRKFTQLDYMDRKKIARAAMFGSIERLAARDAGSRAHWRPDFEQQLTEPSDGQFTSVKSK